MMWAMSRKNYFERLIRIPEERLSLAEAALHIAEEEYPDLPISEYVGLLDTWARELKKKRSKEPAQVQIARINDHLFGRLNFSGNTENYYDPRNSYLNEVIDRRKGIPITLSVIYLELAWSLGLDAAGIGIPSHFMVRVMVEGEPLYVDPFHQGNVLTVEGIKDFLEAATQGAVELQSGYLTAMTKKQILTRMLRNLKGIFLEQKNFAKTIQIIDKLIVLNPDLPEEVRDRGIVYYQMQAFRKALSDFELFLSMAPDSQDADVICQYMEILREYTSHLN